MDEHAGDPMNDQGTPGSAEGFSVFAVDANWPESRQVTGHGYNRATGDIHVYLWFGSPYFDPQAEHVTVFSASSGNAEASEALEGAFGLCQVERVLEGVSRFDAFRLRW
ncbi:hypothetical protein [Streptomyces sp. NPDC057580]|uniref:hypothetical protein n=1 Tax=Streptomyces sp. NPDC057580 TaxID=3346173 RepID=UPI003688134C